MNDEEGDLEDCDSDYRQYIDGNRDLAGSNQLHEVKGKKVGAISAFLVC